MSRVAVVTGGASGIGLGVARQLVADGHQVAILDRNGAAAEAAADELRAQRAAPRWPSRSTSPIAARSTPRSSGSAPSSGPVEILVTSAGIESFDPVLDITPEKWDRILAVNLTGTFTCVQAALPDMLAAGWGRIVTIASSSAQSGAPQHGALRGVEGWRHLAHQGAGGRARPAAASPRTRITPSLVDTPMSRQAEADGDFPGVDVIAPMVPLGRAGTPADIAAACSFLCSEGGSYITGQVIGVNGGMYI